MATTECPQFSTEAMIQFASVLRRFQERANVPYKQYKITEEDWRNRDRWHEYVDAVGDMVDRTSTTIAPWTLVEANDKNFARIKVLKTLCERIEKAMKK
jgi:polyphosphate kinase 2 (PPK2 family)